MAMKRTNLRAMLALTLLAQCWAGVRCGEQPRPALGETRTSVFGLMGQGSKFVYVFDRSGSMGGGPLDAAKTELAASLQDLGETDQFQIIFYNDRPKIFHPAGAAGRLLFGNAQNKKRAAQFIASISADGSTHHESALLAALKMQPDVIFFLTDADQPGLSPAQMARVRKWAGEARIYAIEFGSVAVAGRDNFLVRLANETGGEYKFVEVSELGAG